MYLPDPQGEGPGHEAGHALHLLHTKIPQQKVNLHSRLKVSPYQNFSKKNFLSQRKPTFTSKGLSGLKALTLQRTQS